MAKVPFENWNWHPLIRSTVDLSKLEIQLLKDVEQIRRQQVHIDEIKKLCHVKN